MTDDKLRLAGISVGFGSSGPLGTRTFKESPLVCFVVSELAASQAGNALALPPQPVDATGIDNLMEQVTPHVDVTLAHPLVPRASLRVTWEPRRLRDFRPQRMTADIAVFGVLRTGREILLRARDGALGVAEAERELAALRLGDVPLLALLDEIPVAAAEQLAALAAPAKAAEEEPASLDALALLGLDPDAAQRKARAVPTAPALDPRAAIAKIATAVAQGGATTRRQDGFGPAVQRVERAIVTLLGQLLEHPSVRRLESAWRGLSLLCGKARGAQIWVVPCAPGGAIDALSRLDQAGAVPDLLLLDAVLAPGELSQAGAWGAAHYAPVLAGGGPSLCSEELALAEGRARPAAPSHELDEAASGPDAGWVALAAAGLFLRGPYDSGQARIGFDFNGNLEATPLLLSDALALAAVILDGHARDGHPYRFQGVTFGALEGLAVEERHGMASAVTPRLTDAQHEKLGARGLVTFGGVPNRDSAFVGSAPTLALRKGGIGTAGLPDQLLAGRAVRALLPCLRELRTGVFSAEEVDARVKAALLGAVPEQVVSGAGVSVDGRRLAVTLYPRVLGQASLNEIHLELPLG